MNALTPKEAPSSPTSVETAKLVVSQPAKLESLLGDLETLESFSARVSERTSEDRSQDMGTAGAGASAGQQTKGASPRDQAIAAMPTAPEILRKELAAHVEKEVKKLRRLAHRAETGRPGDAFHLNELYARIRRLNSLLGQIIQASLDVLKRLFIRVFIDRQSII